MPDYVDIILPAEAEEGTESIVGQWLKEPGQTVREHEPLLEVNTDKVVVEIPSPASGELAECSVQAGDPVTPGQRLGRIRLDGQEEVSPDETPQASAPSPSRPKSGEEPGAPPPSETRLSPAVRRLLRKHELDTSEIQGSGRGGRITYHDVTAFLDSRPEPPAGDVGAAAEVPARRVSHTPMRKAIARHMVQSVRTAPHVTAVFEADFSAVVADRARRRETFEKRGVKLTYTAYLVAAAAQALLEVPEVNSRWHEKELEIFEDCNIGVAVGLGKQGLTVPVVARAQNLSLFGIASRLQELTRKARDGKLAPAELEGGTFTITNHGGGGSLIATPIIHQPQSAILGVGKVEKRLKIVEEPEGDSIRIHPLAYVTLTVDHRALDGETANLFLSRFVEAMEGAPPGNDD